MSPTSLVEKQQARLKVLRAFYELTDGEYNRFVPPEAVVRHTGLGRDAVRSATEYLEREGLVKFVAIGGTASITHSGVIEVEEALAGPGAATEHFPRPIISQVIYGNVGVIQTGAGNTATVTQTVGADATEILKVIAALRAAVPAARADLLETVDDLEAEAKTGSAKPSRVRAYLAQLNNAAVDVATVGPFVIQLAKMFGVDLPGNP